jgi:concentrative nucleoside transporter, CNT family
MWFNRLPSKIKRMFLFFTTTGIVGYLSFACYGALLSPDTVSAGTQVAAKAAETATSSPINRYISFLGIIVFLGLCWLMSRNRKKINMRIILWGLGLQFVFGLLILKTTAGLWVFQKMNDFVLAMLNFTQDGTTFLFQSLVTGKMEAPFINFTFVVLPTIIFFSSLATIMYYLGVMQWVVKGCAKIMQKTMKTSGAETLCNAANIFLGQTEAPLVIKPYVKDLTKSELVAVMVGGFANTSVGALAAYVGILHGSFPDIAGHLVAQSVMSAPAALLCAKMVFPEEEKSITGDHVEMVSDKKDANVIDAASRGASEGLTLVLNVAAMLLAFIALIAMINAGLQAFTGWVGLPKISLEMILGYVCWPIAWIMGIPAHDCMTVGQLIGVKTVLNEFVAYLQMGDILKAGGLSPRSMIIAAYALCSFANFSSIAIQIGGISGIAPNKRSDLARFGLKAMIVGAIAACMTGCVAGVLIP